MTSRVRIFGSDTTPLQVYNTATGTDGKYETSQGKQREKWNAYTLEAWRTTRSPGLTPSFIGDQWWAANATYTRRLGANDILTVQSRLAEAVKGHQFNLAVSAAQGKQTVNMVVDAVSSISGAIRDLKRGKFESAARRFGVAQRPSTLSHKDVAGRWLELQYGWLPLISDVYEAAKAYEAITSNARKSRVSASVNLNYEIDISNSPSNYSCKGPIREGMRIIYEMTEQLSTPRSLGLLNPASVVWELIPYSFVIDWVYPIGTYLENLDTIPRLNGRFCTTHHSRFQGSAIKRGLTKWTRVPTAHTSNFWMQRTVSTSLSVPKPQFISLPDAMSPKRIWNAIALGAQRIR